MDANNEVFQCAICKNYLYATKHQCQRSHSICNACKVKDNTNCPLCESIVNNSQIAKEQLLPKMLIYCMHTKCKEVGTAEYIKDHYAICDYENVKCNVPSCNWLGTRIEFTYHLNLKHKWAILKNGENLNVSQFKLCIIEYRQQFFWVKQYLVNTTMFWVAQHVTSVKEDEKYFYTITIDNKEGETWMFRQPCQHHLLSDRELQNRDKYLLISHRFFNHNNCAINIKICHESKVKDT